MGAARRGGTGTGLPAPLSAAPAGGRADRLREDLIGTAPCFSPSGVKCRINRCCYSTDENKISKYQGLREVLKCPAIQAGNTPNRWVQLWLGVLCMVLIANLQYAWTLFVNPIHQAHGWSIAEIQVAFSIFIATETWLTPIEGYIVDHLGPTHRPAADGDLRWRAGGRRLGDQRLRQHRWKCSMSAPPFPAPARARSTPPASATR